MTALLDAYRRTVERVAGACERAGRDPAEVTILAVSKGRDPSEIRMLHDAGHRDFGENRAQELRDKIPELPDAIRWHFVGPLQTNKVRIVRPSVVALHSMDRIHLAEAWLKGRGMPPPVYLQVNIGHEEQKSGVAPEEAPDMVARLEEMGITVVGLMTIPPRVERPEEARPFFVRMAGLRDRIAIDHPRVAGLSMGMTEDFEVAVEEGASVIRVGRAIFEA